MQILSRLSPEARCYVVEDLAETYFNGGFNPAFRSGPTDEREARIYQELVAVRLMERSPSDDNPFQFTEGGLKEILELRPVSPGAAALLAEVQRQHGPGEFFGELMGYGRFSHNELVARALLRKGEGDTYALPGVRRAAIPMSDPHGSERAGAGAQKETQMSEEARTVFERIRREYLEAGCPPRHNKSFGPNAGEHRGFTELVAHGLLRLIAGRSHILTEKGLAEVMAR